MRDSALAYWEAAKEEHEKNLIEAIETILGQYFSWDHFENTHRGEIHTRGYTFYMRVGLFLGRPVQAIIFRGHIIRTKSAQHYIDDKCVLTKLNPNCPNDNLYPNDWKQSPKSPKHFTALWKPKR
jgi:hypothetical protein